jgi:hypothetical protein
MGLGATDTHSQRRVRFYDAGSVWIAGRFVNDDRVYTNSTVTVITHREIFLSFTWWGVGQYQGRKSCGRDRTQYLPNTTDSDRILTIMWNEAVVSLFQNLPGGADENHENSLRRWLMS